MKKGFIFTIALAMVLGAGVAVGAHHAPVKETKADTPVTLYLDTNHLDWYGDQSRAYLYGTGGDNGWPGESLTNVSGNIYKLDITDVSKYQNLIFLRSNGTDVWNRTSKDGGVAINLPADWSTEDMWVFGSGWDGNTEYDDGNYTGSWSKYSAPVDPTEVKYYAKIGDGSYTLMTYSKSFVYDETKTGYEFALANVSATTGDIVSFRKESSETIQPGASSTREDKENNMVYSHTTTKIKVVQTVTNQTLRLFVYESGYDSFLSGLTENVKTFYFTNNQSWECPPKVYAFLDDEFSKSEWPGDEMTFVDIDSDNHSRYSFSIDVNKWPNFILANNAGTDQTIDLKFSEVISPKNGFYLYERVELKDNHWSVGEYEYVAATRSVLVGSTAKPLSKTPDFEEEGYVAQYETPSFEMHAQESIKYYVGSDEKAFDLQAYGRNNAYMKESTPRILTEYDGKIYVKITTDSKAVMFVSGISEVSEGYHIYLNDSSIIELSNWPGEIPEGFDGQTYCESVTFHQNDKFRLVDTKGNKAPTPFSPARFDEASEDVFTFEGGYVKYTGTADYEASIYLKLKSENDMIYVGGALPENAAAKKFAIGFNDALGAVCKADNTTDYEALETAWVAQKGLFTALTAEAQKVLKDATTSHDIQDIADFIAKYEYIFARYGTRLGDGNNFLNKPISASLAEIGTQSVADSSTMIVVVSVIALVSVSSVAILLVIKKRKHN